MNQYEGMFLIDPTFGASFENCEAEIKRLMERAEAELVFCKKWDERRLAYHINGRKRGVYVLTYFKAKPDKIVSLERDVKLSEDILRVLVLRANEITPEAMEKAMTMGAPQPEEDNFGDGGRFRHPRGGDRHSDGPSPEPAPAAPAVTASPATASVADGASEQPSDTGTAPESA